MSVHGTRGSKALESAREDCPGRGDPLNSLHQYLSHLIRSRGERTVWIHPGRIPGKEGMQLEGAMC
eukprot:5077192-Prorocentrum_lima.AAC.1